MSNMTASIEAQRKITPKTMDEIREWLLSKGEPTDEQNVNICYLMHLCIRGKLDATIAFLDHLGSSVKDVVNSTCPKFHRGTPLHVALCWNSGEIGHQFFQNLWDYGADYYYDSYGHLPWDQIREIRWIDPITEQILGTRDANEFTEGYKKLRQDHKLEIYETRYHLHIDKETLEAMG